jgi:K+-transporting ATPase ATPase A chain
VPSNEWASLLVRLGCFWAFYLSADGSFFSREILMTENGLLQIFLYVLVLLLLAMPLGHYMARVYEGHSFLKRWLGPVEQRLYRICGIAQQSEMRWTEYATAVLVFNLMGAGLVYTLQRFQNSLPLNPQLLPNIGADTAFNTAVSFATNTNWQSYSGEASLS